MPAPPIVETSTSTITTNTATSSCTTSDDIEIQSSHFAKALERFVHENKPDPLVKRQFRSWTFQWNQGERTEEAEEKIETTPDEAHYFLSGTLRWSDNEKCTATLVTSCRWKGTSKDGQIDFHCKGYIDFQKANTKVHKKVMQRMLQDSYVQEFLPPTEHDVLEARIRIHEQSLEEVVHVNQKAARALQRTLFTSAQDTMDVFDLLLTFPFLPCTFHTDSRATTDLADRVRLRILEDVTYDACEEEEEQEMVQDLHISKKAKK